MDPPLDIWPTMGLRIIETNMDGLSEDQLSMVSNSSTNTMPIGPSQHMLSLKLTPVDTGITAVGSFCVDTAGIASGFLFMNTEGSTIPDWGGGQCWPVTAKSPDDVDDPDANGVPHMYSLDQNKPNPFNPKTRISFSLKRSGRTVIVVYNILGEKVRTLIDRQMMAGVHSVEWDSKDDRGQKVSSGIYLYKMNAEEYHETRKMILLK
jgi:hypothetical protein